MNYLSGSYDSSKYNIFASFNQDCTSLAVSYYNGYRILSLSVLDCPMEICESETEDICIVERLFGSSLLAMVSLNSPRKLKVCHFKKGTEICNYSYSNTILSVKLNRSRLVVCLEESLYIHNIRDMAVLHTLRDTPTNPRGLLALSTDSDNCYLAYPGHATIGEVQIFDTIHMCNKVTIAAHDSSLAAMAFSPSGTVIATASEKGTVIRVFNVFDGAKLHEFRRGVKRCVNIFGLAFSPDSSLLAATSNTETVHVFKLENPKDVPYTERRGANAERQAAEDNSWMGYLTKAVTASANYIPLLPMSVLSQGRAFASAFLPQPGHRNICAITEYEKVLRLLVASSDGHLYIYALDKNEGGDCTLMKTVRLLKKVDPPDPDVPQSLRDGSKTGDVTERTESEKINVLEAATRRADDATFKLDDDGEFPPVNLQSD